MKITGKKATLGIFCLCMALFAPPLCAQPFPDEEPLYNEESALNEEPAPGEEAMLSEESFFDEETLFAEEEYDYSFLFEAPPLIFEASPVLELRSFDDIFPGFSRGQKRAAMGDFGLRHAFEKDGAPALLPDTDSGIDLLSSVMEKNPSHVIEALVVVPYNQRELDMLDIYNALGRIKNIQDHPYHANDRDVVIFKETTRLESAKNKKPVADPSSADELPYGETMYLRFTDAYIGDLFIRGDISVSLYGITYSMTNFTDIYYSLFRIMRAERFSAIIYLEPVKEGILVYGMSGLYLPGLITKRMNLSSNINVRLTVLIDWITDGLRRQESVIVRQKHDIWENSQYENRYFRLNNQ